MFSFFRRSKPAAEDSFKSRVDRFWQWYSSAAKRMLDTIDDKRCGDLTEEVSERVEQLGPGFGWVFGPGKDGAIHSFTLSGEGVVHRQILTQYWQKRAPQLEGWSFHGSRLASDSPGEWHISTLGEIFEPKAFWVSVFVNEQEEAFDLRVWHPLFEKLPDKDRFQILFIILDELLGEFGTQQWINEIKFSNERLGESMPILEMREFIKAETTRRKWNLTHPGEVMTLFSFKEDRNFRRGDLLTWMTTIPGIVRDYFDADGKPDDPFKGTGAGLFFLSLPLESFPKGAESATRGKIEEAFDSDLRANASGQVIGGGFGRSAEYVDVLLFENEAALGIIKSTARRLGLSGGVQLWRYADAQGRPALVL